MPRICIAVETYHKPGQTFVNRHVEHMFGGNTCVYANRLGAPDPFGKSCFIRRAEARTVAERLSGPFVKLWTRARHKSSRMLAGRQRKAFIAFLRAERVDLILAEFGTEAQTMSVVARETGIPCFGYFRGSDASQSVREPMRLRSYREMMPHLTGIFAVSRFLLENLAGVGVTHPNAHVVPSGVDVRRFLPGTKRPRTYLAVGRMIEKKAPHLTLTAFARATEGTDATLRFIGDGPLRDRCERLAADLGVADRVVFDGAQTHDAVCAALAEAQVFLQHSVTGKRGNTEGLPTAIQEALAAGCIVISTRHAGIPEAIDDGQNGWLCEEHDLAGMTALIRESLTADTAAMADAARQTALDRFDNAVLLKRTEGILSAAL